MKLIDLSHTFKENMPVYPGDSSPEFTKISEVSIKGHNNYQVKTSMHVGTHIDAPFHMLENGKRLSEINIEKFFGKGVLIDARGKNNLDIDLLNNIQIQKGSIVLVFTGHDKNFGENEYYSNCPLFTEAFAKKMVEYKVKILGMDTPSPDKAPYPIHKILLKEEILIIENLTNLESLIEVKDFEVIALPPKMDLDGAPIRVVARVKDLN